jgi:hypothetical protein
MKFSSESMGRAQEVVSRLHYRGWRFHVGADALNCLYLQMQWIAPHSLTHETVELHGRKWRLSEHMTTSEIVQTALMAVLAAEEHEARERFLFDGRPIFGPHLNCERLWQLADEPQDVRK